VEGDRAGFIYSGIKSGRREKLAKVLRMTQHKNPDRLNGGAGL